MLTVLIATYNGARTLAAALGAYCHIQAPKGGWKLVVVDNGSTDATREIIHSFKDRLPLTYLFEPSRGKNVALNTGLSSVEGDLISLTDDDILPRSDWLQELRLAADSHPSFSVFGGRVIPRWEVQPDEWLLSRVKVIMGMGAVYALTDPSWEEGPIDPGHVFGGNMAIRTRIFETGHRFDPRIGPRGQWYAMGSETDLTKRLSRGGFHSWHCKNAVVEHMIRKSQMTQEWILSRALIFGRGMYRSDLQYQHANSKKCWGIPSGLIMEAVKKGVGSVQAKLYGDRTKLFDRRWALNYLLGQATEAWLIHKVLRSDGAKRSSSHSESVVDY